MNANREIDLTMGKSGFRRVRISHLAHWTRGTQDSAAMIWGKTFQENESRVQAGLQGTASGQCDHCPDTAPGSCQGPPSYRPQVGLWSCESR